MRSIGCVRQTDVTSIVHYHRVSMQSTDQCQDSRYHLCHATYRFFACTSDAGPEADTTRYPIPLSCRTKSIVQAAVQKRNSEALSAMTFAATLGDVDSMEHLLQRGLLINTADYDGRTTLHLAALEGNVKVLELLLQEGADPNVRDRQVHGMHSVCLHLVFSAEWVFMLACMLGEVCCSLP